MPHIPAIKGLNHMTFICKDLNKTSEFLKYVFNAEEIYSSGDKIFSISREKFFNLAGLWIAIMEGEPIEKTYNHIAFSVTDTDLDFFEQRINELGLTILPSRERVAAEGKSLYFYDYDNHLFELNTGDLATRLGFYNRD